MAMVVALTTRIAPKAIQQELLALFNTKDSYLET
jgi:hypothetical protein